MEPEIGSKGGRFQAKDWGLEDGLVFSMPLHPGLELHRDRLLKRALGLQGHIKGYFSS
jgi:hypothetical protein